MKRGTIVTARSLCSLASAVVIALAACGGAAKKDTTPKPGTGSGSGSNTQEMSGGPSPSGGGGTTNTGGGGGSGSGSGVTTVDGSGNPTPPPPVVFPNQDPDPQAAHAQVEQHLMIARGALSSTPPDPDNALREARAALQSDATSVDAAAMVAFAYYHKKLYDTSELVLDELFKRDSAKQNPLVYYVYGLVYDHTNRPDAALLAFKKAVELKPDFASALVDLGVHQLQNKQYADAQATFEKVTQQLRRTDAITLTALGSAYRGRAGDYPPGSGEGAAFVKKAEATYRQALQVSPTYGLAYYDLGLLYLDTVPAPGGGQDPIAWLNTAKGFFDQYKTSKDYDPKLYDARMKDYSVAMKRAQKAAKKAGGGTKKVP